MRENGSLELGDIIHEALAVVGVTPTAVKKLIGKDCNCEQNQEKLNALDRWARRVVAGKTENARTFLRRVLK